MLWNILLPTDGSNCTLLTHPVFRDPANRNLPSAIEELSHNPLRADDNFRLPHSRPQRSTYRRAKACAPPTASYCLGGHSEWRRRCRRSSTHDHHVVIVFVWHAVIIRDNVVSIYQLFFIVLLFQIPYPHIDAQTSGGADDFGGVGQTSVVGYRILGRMVAACLAELRYRHRLGLVAGQESHVDVLDFGAFRDELGVAGDVDAESFQVQDVAVAHALGVQIAVARRDVIGRHGIKRHAMAEVGFLVVLMMTPRWYLPKHRGVSRMLVAFL